MPYSYKLVNEETVSAVTATPSVSLGTRRLEGPTEYVYAYNDGAIAQQGAPVILTGCTGYSYVVTFATAADARCTFLGIVQNATVAAGSYGWVAVRGFANARTVATAVALNDNLAVLDGGGSVHAVTFTSSITQLVSQGIIGKALSISSAGASAVVGVFIR
jgi:hypothetical protein